MPAEDWSLSSLLAPVAKGRGEEDGEPHTGLSRPAVLPDSVVWRDVDGLKTTYGDWGDIVWLLCILLSK